MIATNKMKTLQSTYRVLYLEKTISYLVCAEGNSYSDANTNLFANVNKNIELFCSWQLYLIYTY